MSWVDSHCHLTMVDDPTEAIARADAAGVNTMVTVGVDLDSDQKAIALAESHEHVWAAVGVHPNDCEDVPGDWPDQLASMAEHPKVVAIGESGLDFYRDHTSPASQAAAFTHHIDLSKQLDKALIIHMRDSHEAVFAQLTAEGPPERLIFHCFSGGPEDARIALGLGGYLSFAGNISFPKSDDLREAAKTCPMDRILVETDSPFLSPAPLRGKPNEPARIPLIGEAVAMAKGVTREQVEAATSANLASVMGIG